MSAEDYFDDSPGDQWGDERPGSGDVVEYAGCKFGKVSKSGKAIFVAFPDGARRWVPFSQMPEGCPDEGREGTLVVSAWIVERWEEEGEDPRNRLVRVPDVVVLRESAKAIQVRAPGADEPVWVAKSQIADSSEVHHDGDGGVLVVPNWVAEDKGMTSAGWGMSGAKKPARPSVAEDVERTSRRRQEAARERDREEKAERARAVPPPDDDIPF